MNWGYRLVWINFQKCVHFCFYNVGNVQDCYAFLEVINTGHGEGHASET